MVNVFEYYDKLSSVCSFWRGRGVLSELERIGYISLTQANWREDWTSINRHHIAIFQRPMGKSCLQQVAMCKEYGVKIWADLDDWMYIPNEHPKYKEYTRIFDLKYFTAILSLADIISVTNPQMKECYSEYVNKDKIVVIPNALNDRIYKFNNFSGNKIIVWRGGENHIYDIKPYLKAIKNVLKNNKDWSFISIGEDLQEFKKLSNYKHIPELSLHDYFALLMNIKPSLIIVPLKRNKFNELKSNIAWLEATLVGASVIMPSWSDYHIGFDYDSESDFENVFNNALSNLDNIELLHSASKSVILKDYVLSQVNNLRLNLIYDTTGIR